MVKKETWVEFPTETLLTIAMTVSREGEKVIKKNWGKSPGTGIPQQRGEGGVASGMKGASGD